MAEFDVEYCFLNRPIALVLPALNYWFTFDFRSRHGPSVLPSVKTGRQKTMLADAPWLLQENNCEADTSGRLAYGEM